ncbi:MAG: sugar phosphate isomerase/epimerase [Chloroflexi bacterium]|nr:sugar phosphate isomerase/epimerase [Chloroflexota bacterium]
MKIAGHTMGTPGLSAAEALRLFAAIGLDAAEIIWQDDYLSGLPETAGDERVDEVRSLASDLRLDISCLTPYMTGINSLDPDERARDIDRFARCIRVAERLACPYIRVYAGRYLPGDPHRDEQWHRLVESLQTLDLLATESGVTLCVENHFNTMTVTAAETAALMQAVGSPAVGILYDQVNLAFTHSEAYPEAIARQRPWIRYVHVKDLVFTDPGRAFSASAVSSVATEERTVRSRVVGEGITDWPAILGDLRAGGYDGYLSMEYEYRWHPQDLPEPEAGFRRGAAYLRQLLGTQVSRR